MSILSKKVVSGALTATTFLWATGALSLIPVASAQTATELQAQIAALLAQIQQLQAQLGGSQDGGMMSFTFTRNLTLGSTGDDVKALQEFLNSHGAQVATTGPGSPGNESTYFGAKTKAALARYQASVGISPTLGYFGPKTMTHVNGLTSGGPIGGGVGDQCVNIEGIQTTVPAGYARDVLGNCTIAVVPGGFSVAIAPDNPAGAAIPFGANNVRFMAVILSGSATVNTLTFTRVGAGQTTDFVSSGVYLLDENGARLTTGRTVNSTTHKVTFTGLNLTISGVKKLWLVAAVRTNSSGAGNRNAFEISSAADISGSVAAGGTFPIRGNEFILTSAGVGGVTISSSTDPTNPKVGEQQAKLATIRIENTSSTDDLEIQTVALRYAGAVSRGNLSNFVLKYAGQVVGSATVIDAKDLLTIRFSPSFLLERGQNRIFELFGDVAPGVRAGSTETIIWYIEDSNDVVAVSKLYGYGAIVTNSYGNSSTAGQNMTIDGGQITITFNGPTAQDLPTNGQDLTFLDFNVSSQNNVEVKNLRFSVTTTGMGGATNEKLSDLKIIDAATGSVIAGPYGTDITTTTTGIVLADTWSIGAGQSRRLLVKADVGSASALNNDTAYVTHVAFNGTDIKNVDSNTDVSTSDIVPNGQTGNTMTLKAPDLSITLAGTPTSRTLTAGTPNVDLVAFNFRAVADDIQIKSIKVSASSTTGAASASDVTNALSNLSLIVDNAQLGQTKGLTGSSQPVTADFTNLNYTIRKGDTKTITVRSSRLASNASSTSYAVRLNDLSADIVAVDTQGNTLSLSGSLNGGSGTIVLTVGTPSLTVLRLGAGSVDTDTGHVVGGNTRVLTRLMFTATNGDVTVKKLQFGVSAANTNETSTGISDDVMGIFFRECSDPTCTSKTTIVGGTEGVPIDATGERAGTTLVESPTGFFTVPRSGNKYFTVEAKLASVITGSTEGADSGTSLFGSLRLSNFEAVAGNTTLTTFTTSTGGTSLGIVGTEKFVLGAEPTLSVAKPSGFSLGNGVVPVLDLTVGANGGAVYLKAFGINVAATAATVSAPSTSNISVIDITGGGSNSLTIGSVSGAVITGGNNGDIYIVLTNAEAITPGSAKTYRVRVTAADVSTTVGAARLVTQLDRNETAISTSTAVANAALLSANGNYGANTNNQKVWVWSDLADSVGTETDTQWNNAALIRPFPVDAFAITN